MGSPLARQGRAVWGTLTSVPFAVLLIILLAIPETIVILGFVIAAMILLG
mgnify:CR=1 FL=1